MLTHVPISSVHKNGITVHTRESCGVLQFVMLESVRHALVKHIELTTRMQETCRRHAIDQLLATRFVDEWVDIRAANATFSVYISYMIIEISKGLIRLTFHGQTLGTYTVTVNNQQFEGFARRVRGGPGIEFGTDMSSASLETDEPVKTAVTTDSTQHAQVLEPTH
jgi:hypothetical protein